MGLGTHSRWRRVSNKVALSVLAALVLQEVVQPIFDKLNRRARAALRRRRHNKYDDGAGGESHPMAYIDDLRVFIPHEDLLFFLTEFARVGLGYGCFLNTKKASIMTSTSNSGVSAIPAIAQQFGQDIADQDQEAILPQGSGCGCKEIGGECSHRQYTFGRSAGSLDCLTPFSQCILNKLPHLLGSEVLYRFTRSSHDEWNRWSGSGPLAVGIDEMANTFLAKLAQLESTPHTSLLIAYISIAQGGLGMMDAMSRAIPDFVLTLAHATRRFAKYGASPSMITNSPAAAPIVG
ncbi:LOW QUALITY PROTEIN: hypothetical protein ACHAXR_002051 [Thalassiosira sp. AJA248-18]